MYVPEVQREYLVLVSEESCLVAPAISVCIGKGVFGGGGGCGCVEGEGCVWVCGGGVHVGEGGTGRIYVLEGMRTCHDLCFCSF